jgi:ribosomal protein S18 acetylase RimI-like enzyme
MSEIKIQKLTPNNIEQLQKIGKQTFIETFGLMNSEINMVSYLENGFSIAKLKSELIDVNSEFYFAVTYGIEIGYLKINFGMSQTEIKDSNALEIERIYVLKKYHGTGVGQMLYNKAIEIAKHLSSDFIWLGVWEENLRAINFYKRNGFVAFDTHIFRLGDDEQTDIMMKLNLR